jgi:predicted dehydrogenase
VVRRGIRGAKKLIDGSRIGTPLLFKATSRDRIRPSLEFANPWTSGGMIVDMGIHDFDLARWFMGDVTAVSAIGAAVAYPELGALGDIDTAVVCLTFSSGNLGVFDLTRSGIYAYDITTEILGLAGTIRLGYLRETPIMTADQGVSHDTVPGFTQRFRDAYVIQLQNFAQNVLHEREPPIAVDDGFAALRIALAASMASTTGTTIALADF